MKRFIKRNIVFIIAILIICTVPIGLNFLIPLENKYYTIFGNEETWFAFWSSYSGAVISGLITLFVLYKTLRQNQDNHKKQQVDSLELNRKQMNFQVKLMDYQNKNNWLNDLKNRLSSDLEILDFSNVEKLAFRISLVSSNKELMDDISNFEKKINATQNNLIILYNGKFDSKERKHYKVTSDNLVKNLIKIIAAFRSYLVKMEVVIIETQSRIDCIKDVPEMDITPLVIMKEQGYKDFSKKREDIYKKMESYRKEADLIKVALRIALIELIKYEEKNINNEVLI